MTNTSHVSRILTPDDFVGDGDDVLHCPVCGYNYVHIGDIHQRSAGDDYVHIRFSAECGHGFTITFQHHKGNTTAYVENVTETRHLTYTGETWQQKGETA